MTDVLQMIHELKESLWKEYGDILRFTYSGYENRMTYYVSDLLEKNGMGHDENYKWDQKAINAAFIAGMRVGAKDTKMSNKELYNDLIAELQDHLETLIKD